MSKSLPSGVYSFYRDTPPCYDDPEPHEAVETLQSAIKYLRANYPMRDSDGMDTAEWEAVGEMESILYRHWEIEL